MKALDILQGLGYRLTPQRIMVLSAIESSEGHISAEEIYSQVRVKYPYANISTIYRTLELLKNLGLVTQTDLGEGIVRYHSQEKGHHHHLVCKSCGRVEDLPESALFPLRDSLLRDYHFKAELRHLAIFGYCQSCTEKKK
jgi:Fur family ferric uptake transcriptional regulator